MNYKMFVLTLGFVLFSQIGILGKTPSPKFSEIKFDIKDLSQSGQSVYETLLKAKVFTLNGHGDDAAPYPQTLALVTLLKEKNADKALQSIIRNAHPEGQIYGLLGLQIIKSKVFKADLVVFRNQFSELENQTKLIRSESGGCMSQATTLKRIEVINKLEAGSLAEIFLFIFPKPKYEKRNTANFINQQRFFALNLF